MKIVVIGASGLIGSKLVNRLRQAGRDVVEASLASGVNTITGEGLAKALTGAEVVVCSTSEQYMVRQVWAKFSTRPQTRLPA